jgi:tetratricopeptide (TPR) repeat protein
MGNPPSLRPFSGGRLRLSLLPLGQMISVIRATLLSAALAMALGGSVFAAPPVLGDLLNDGVELYKRHKYDDGVKLFEECISENPTDAAAHYYLANCYLAQGKYDEARRSYEICLKCKPNAKIASYAMNMQMQLVNMPKAPEPGPPPTAVGAFDQRRFDEEIAELKQRNRQRVQDAANARIASLQAQIDRITRDMNQDLEYEPAYYWGRRGRRSNPNSVYIRQDAARRINDLQRQINDTRMRARNEAVRSDSLIEHTFSELATQAKSTKGGIKPVLTSRSIYVRDYVHFSGSDPTDFEITPLRATAGKYTGGSKNP